MTWNRNIFEPIIRYYYTLLDVVSALFISTTSYRQWWGNVSFGNKSVFRQNDKTLYAKRMTAGDTVTEDESLIVYFPFLNDHVGNPFISLPKNTVAHWDYPLTRSHNNSYKYNKTFGAQQHFRLVGLERAANLFCLSDVLLYSIVCSITSAPI